MQPWYIPAQIPARTSQPQLCQTESGTICPKARRSLESRRCTGAGSFGGTITGGCEDVGDGTGIVNHYTRRPAPVRAVREPLDLRRRGVFFESPELMRVAIAPFWTENRGAVPARTNAAARATQALR